MRNQIIIISASFLLMGCSGIMDFNEYTQSNPVVPTQLEITADRVAASMEKLALVQQTLTPPRIAEPESLPPELERTLETIEWAGPIAPILQKIASEAGYAFIILGSPPKAPIMVHLNKKETTIFDVLRDLGLKAGKRATVLVDADRRKVELHYE